ncbi:MAG: hypothetical protein HZC15_05275 [Candidatus Omnitrophica bacterium]|nr:hypothetical protein [Candidatus Omnitrophota bacterium]
MKIEVKKIDSIKREMTIEISGETVKNKFEEVFKAVAKEAKVPGFRPGNAPRDMLEKHYSGAVHEQVLKELVPDVYNKALEQEKLDVVELPEIFDVKLDRNSLSFKARIEVNPEIALKKYKGIKVNYNKISVGPEEIKRSLDSLKEARKMDILDDAFAKSISYPNLAELEKALERQIFLQKENAQRQRIEAEIIDGISKDLNFELPKSLVARQVEEMLRQTKMDLAIKGMPREKIEEREKDMLSQIEPAAKEQVKVYLILAEIAKKENIALDDAMPRKVVEFLLKEADWQESA